MENINIQGGSLSFNKGLKSSVGDLERFWDIQSNDIVLVSMHGSMLCDGDMLIRTDKLLYGEGQPTVKYWADLILTMLAKVPQYRNGDHALFSFNGVSPREETTRFME